MNNSALIPIALPLILLFGGCSASPAQNATSTPSVTLSSTPAPTAATPPSETSSSTPTPTAAAARTAKDLASAIKQASSTKIVAITEDNDPNDLLGRPNGYTDAAVIYDKGATCDSLGIDCGATIEIWPTGADAEKRSEYIQGILKDLPALGNEYHTIRENALLRISGQIKPSVAKTYQKAFAA